MEFLLLPSNPNAIKVFAVIQRYSTKFSRLKPIDLLTRDELDARIRKNRYFPINEEDITFLFGEIDTNYYNDLPYYSVRYFDSLKEAKEYFAFLYRHYQEQLEKTGYLDFTISEKI